MYNLHILKICRLCTERLYLTLTSFGEENITNYLWNCIMRLCTLIHPLLPFLIFGAFWFILCFSYICSLECGGLVSDAWAFSLALLVPSNQKQAISVKCRSRENTRTLFPHLSYCEGKWSEGALKWDVFCFFVFILLMVHSSGLSGKITALPLSVPWHH